MVPYKLYDEYSVENFGESEFIYSCEGVSHEAFKTALDEGRLAVRVSQRHADILARDPELHLLASRWGILVYAVQHRLSGALVVVGVSLGVASLAGLFQTGWWLGLAAFLAGFFTTRFSQEASRRFHLGEAMDNPGYYEAAGRLSRCRLFRLGVRGGVVPF